jgi:hypothetical protein
MLFILDVKGKTQPQVDAPEVRRAPEAVRPAAVDGVGVPATATIRT